MAGMARHGVARRVPARPGPAWLAWLGRAWQSRYQHIAALAPIVTAIEAAVRNVERRRKAPRRAEAVAATP